LRTQTITCDTCKQPIDPEAEVNIVVTIQEFGIDPVVNKNVTLDYHDRDAPKWVRDALE
jgi:hypothetical protein